jgi:hypothetical protein
MHVPLTSRDSLLEHARAPYACWTPWRSGWFRLAGVVGLGTPTTLKITIVVAAICGEWPSFVGGGPGAF